MIQAIEIYSREDWDKWVATAKAWQPDFVPADPGTFPFLLVYHAINFKTEKTMAYKVFYAVGLKIIANRLNK